MQGLILDEFRQFVVGRLGFKTWESVVQEAGHDLAFCYGLGLPYPDGELSALSGAIESVAFSSWWTHRPEQRRTARDRTPWRPPRLR